MTAAYHNNFGCGDFFMQHFVEKNQNKREIREKFGGRTGWRDMDRDDGLFCKEKWRYSAKNVDFF